MEAQLVGIQKINFVNQNGDKVAGMNLFVAFEDKENTQGLQGLRTEKFFLKETIALPKDIKLNDTIILSFNHKGKIEGIHKAN